MTKKQQGRFAAVEGDIEVLGEVENEKSEPQKAGKDSDDRRDSLRKMSSIYDALTRRTPT